MTQYVCELCKKEFNQKSDFDKHKNKKSPCISIDEIQKLSKTKEIKNDNKSNLTTIFKYCLDVLRDNEHLTGDKALRTLAHLLDLRLLEPQFGKTIDIDNYVYDFSHIESDAVENHKNKLLLFVRFSNLAKEKEDNIPIIMKYLWDDILAVHPKTKNIFLKGRGFDITNQSTYKKLITKLNSFNFETIESDILGEAYEEVIQDIMTGKVLGQFFTPPKVKKMMVNLIDPQINKNGTTEKIFDPAMGTGGFLITCLRDLINKSKVKNINLDWDFIRTKGLGGREAEPDTYQLAVSNMLISSGHMFDVLEKGDSIRNPITNKYDIVLANPPFGIDGLTYDDINHALRNEYLPIKSNSAVPLFLQAIIYMLNIGGRCAVVLPEGQELFSKNNALVAVREFLMKTCDLKEVIYLPAGTFTHTTIKTCVFYFVKKREGKDALDINIKLSKTTQKETGRDYKFSKTHQTTKVHFYDYNPDNNVKHELIEGGVSIDDISKNNYSLNYAEYLIDNTEEEVYDEGIVVKTLGECCNFDIGGTPSRSKNEYYNNGTNLWVSVKELNRGYIYDTNEKITDLGVKKSSVKLFSRGTILFSFKLSIGKTAIVGNPLYSNEAIAGIISKNNKVLDNKYLYYYLTLTDFTKKGSGMLGNGSLNKKSLAKLKIPIPTLDKQKEIIEYMDFIYEKCNKTSNDKIEELKRLNKYCINNQKIFGENEIKKLDEVCEFKNGTNITKDKLKEGEYPVIGGGQSPLGYHNTYNVEENTIIISKDGAYAGFVSRYNKKVFISNHGIYISKIKENINKNYIYYLLKLVIQQKLFNLQKGTAQPGVNKNDIEKIKIPIPSIDKQKEIVDYCDKNENLIKLLEDEIEQNKIQANLFMSSIIKKDNKQIKEESSSDSESDNSSEESFEDLKPKKIVKPKSIKKVKSSSSESDSSSDSESDTDLKPKKIVKSIKKI
jgi:type I restriction-modification system DNA methylase subunit/restriction endonuclease S subunit